MKLIHDSGYSKEDREAYKEIIFSNTVQSMRVILEAMKNMDIPIGRESNLQYANLISDLPQQIEGEILAPEISQAIKALWSDTGVLACFDRSSEYQLNDSTR